MKASTLELGDLLVGDVSDQRMVKAVGTGLREASGLGPDELLADQRRQDLSRPQVVLARGQRGKLVFVKEITRHRRDLNDAPLVGREAVEARREGLVDVLAPSEPALLRALDGFRIKGPKARRLRTSGLRVEPFAFDDVVDATGSDDVDRSSVLRSFAVVFGGAAALALAVTGVRRAGPPWRRWRRRRRRARLQKRRSAARH